MAVFTGLALAAGAVGTAATGAATAIGTGLAGAGLTGAAGAAGTAAATAGTTAAATAGGGILSGLGGASTLGSLANAGIALAGAGSNTRSANQLAAGANALPDQIFRQYSDILGNVPGAGQRLEVPGIDVNIDEFLSRPAEVEYDRVEFDQVASRVLNFNVNTAIPKLIPAAQDITAGNVESAKEGVKELFPTYEEAVDNLGRNITDRQNGKLSLGTRRQIARSMLNSGTTELGDAGVDAAYSERLGVTSEQLAQSGDQMSLQATSTFRSLFKNVNAAELMPFGGLTTAQGIQTEISNSQGKLQADTFNVTSLMDFERSRLDATMRQEMFNADQTLQTWALEEQQRQFDVGLLSSVGPMQYESGMAGLRAQYQAREQNTAAAVSAASDVVNTATTQLAF